MTRPINEQDEFLLSRLLDNDLSPEESANLRARLEGEPELQRAYAAMTRIDALLVARRADQPQVDFSRFHSSVMSQVEAEAARPVTIRLANYLRVALPLAAAAAIALVVLFWPHAGPTHIKTPDPGSAIARVEVRYNRPATAGDAGVHVSFARSDELSQEYQAEDEKSRSEESSHTVKVDEPARPSSPGLVAEALMIE